MTDEEKKVYREELVTKCMKYNHIDYDDDRDIIEDMLGAVLEELTDLIDDLDPYNMTFRQKLLVYISVKDLYDHKEKYRNEAKYLSTAVSSMMLKEMYPGGGK